MTSRNLNRTNMDILLEQYISDLAADSPHPIRYLLHDHKFHKDLWWEIPQKVDPQVLRRELVKYLACRRDWMEYECEVFKVYPHPRYARWEEEERSRAAAAAAVGIDQDGDGGGVNVNKE